ncbi:AvrE-family type 3 secretion system effector [Vibrio tritonius]|uniref:AvrE-family type 3 secretion system effector n=1 Tax=Vibrio tritonius TaxID=1435069 RepID=A0ABS7YMM3_9VIBR|nr:AvrE-family type 3 secretion system effector [Vibrio tritonius]MCA2016937.1 AvrE-family type 3 secretion system effector [Vibrio tritonius]
MKINNSAQLDIAALQATQAAAQDSPRPDLQLVQKSATSQYGQVSTLASEGKQAPIPKNLSQQTAAPDGQPLAKQAQKTRTSLQDLFKAASSKSASSSSTPENNASTKTIKREATVTSNAKRPSLQALFAADKSHATHHANESSAANAANKATHTQAATKPVAADVLAAPQLKLSQGKLSIGEQTAPGVSTLLSHTLGKPQQNYLAHHTKDEGAQQWLQDKKGRVIFLATDTQSNLVGLHRSSSLPNPSLKLDGHTLEKQHTPSSNVMSQLTGIHKDKEGSLWRVHRDKLFSIGEHGTWQQTDKNVSKLTSQASGDVYGIEDKKQLTLLGQSSLPKSEENIDGYSVNEKGNIALLFKGDDEKNKPGSIELYSSISDTEDKAQSLSVHLANAVETDGETPPLHLESIGIDNQHLFAIDKENRLLKADLPKADQSRLELSEITPEHLHQALGKDIKLESFLHSDDGAIGLLVKDNHGQQHSCPMDSAKNHFTTGWNLSDVLHVDNTQGLSHVDNQTLDVQDFGKQGKLALHEQTLYAKDPHTQTWREQAKDIDALQRGNDGQAYALQNGKLKKITLSEKSDAISFGDNNLFTLHQTKGNVSLGDGPKGLPEGKLTAAAVINANQHVVLKEDGDLVHTHLHSGTSQAVQPSSTLSQKGIEGKIAQLSVDKDLHLCALTDQGDLFRLDKDQWQHKLRPDEQATWQKVSVPQGEEGSKIHQLSVDDKRNITLTNDKHQSLSLGQDNWSQGHTEPHASGISQRDQLFARLSQATKGTRLTEHGTQINVTAQMGGMSGAEGGQINSKWTSRLKAHVFKPSLEVPRPLQTLGHSVQHKWQGREGLKELYQQQHSLYTELEAQHKQLPTVVKPALQGADLKSRLEKLDLGEQGHALKAAMENLREQVETSAEHQLTALGKHQGIIDKEGALKFDYKPSSTKAAVQTLNPNRSGHNLSNELLNLWKHTPSSPESVPGKMLTSFSALKLDMSHEKTNVPLGRQRDPNDKMSLVKSRLVLDTLTMRKLDTLLTKAESIATDVGTGTSSKAPSFAEGTGAERTGTLGTERTGTLKGTDALSALEKEFMQLANQGYEQTPVKKASDQGLRSNKEAEAAYDATKYFIGAMHDKDNGVNVITRSALKANDQTELNHQLKALLHSMKPSDDVNMTRGYSVDASVTFIPTPLMGHAVNMFPTAGVSEKRNYTLDFNGQDDGVQVTISGNLGPSASGTFGISKNALPHMLDKSPADLKTSLNNGNQTLTPDIMAGAGLTANMSKVEDHQLTFGLKGHDIDQFIDGLTSGKLTVQDLVSKGQEHANTHGTKTSFSLDLGLNINGRLGLALNKKGSDPSAFMRASAGVNAGINLASANKDSYQSHSIDTAKVNVATKHGLLNTATAGVGFDITAGISHKDKNGLLPATSKIAASVTAAIDNSVKVKGELKTKHADPVTKETLDGLRDTLSGAFPDAKSQKVLKDAKEISEPEKQLSSLQEHFGQSEANNDGQHSALNELHKVNIQQQAVQNKGDIISDTKMVVTNSNPAHLDKLGMVDFLTSLVAPSHRHDLTEQIHAMMQQDPNFASVLDKARTNPNTHAGITLELKDDVRQKLEKEFVSGKVSLNEVKAALENPENRRIKSITIFEKGQHKEGFSAPTPLVSGSSTANIYMERDAGSIAFKYGADQKTPRTYTIGGQAAVDQPQIVKAMTDLKLQGMDVKA